MFAFCIDTTVRAFMRTCADGPCWLPKKNNAKIFSPNFIFHFNDLEMKYEKAILGGIFMDVHIIYQMVGQISLESLESS